MERENSDMKIQGVIDLCILRSGMFIRLLLLLCDQGGPHG